MGPTIIIDKSVLHQLTSDEVRLLNKLYNINIPEVLLLEIVSDLYKNKKYESENVQALQRVAQKLDIPFMVTNVRYPELIANSLSGQDNMNVRKPVLKGVSALQIADGGYCGIIDENPYQERLARWRKGVVNKQDIDEALEWRKATQNSNTVALLNNLKDQGLKFNKHDNLCDVIEDVNTMFGLANAQPFLIEQIVKTTIMVPELGQEILNRWNRLGRPLLKDFAPYAHFCWKIQFCFIYCVNSGICGSRKTDICDLQYVMYLPFCDVFCSNDVFHKTFAPAVLLPDQTFISGDELKSDLASILATLSEDPTFNMKTLRGFESIKPPINENSFTYKMWKKYTTLMPDNRFSEIVEMCLASKKREQNH